MRRAFVLFAIVIAAACTPRRGPKAPANEAVAIRPEGWPESADVLRIADRGQLVDLGAHAVAGKVTVFDFYATWCLPCRYVDAHLRDVVVAQPDVAVRQLDVVDWDTPLSRYYLADGPTLPFVIVFDVRGRYVGAVGGLDVARLDRLIAKAR